MAATYPPRPVPNSQGFVPNGPYVPPSSQQASQPGHPHSSTRPVPPSKNIPGQPPVPGQQPSLSQRQTNPHNVSHPPSSQPSTQPKSIQEQVQDVVSEQYAVSTLDDALLCLQKPELAQQKGIIILVTLPNTNGRQVSVAPPEKGMSPEQLKPYMDAASTALSGMKSKYSVRKDDFYEGTYNQLKASYMQEVKKTPGAPDWDTFFANVKKNAHQFRCQLDDGSVVVFSQQTPKKPVPPSHPSVSLKQTKK